MGLQKCSILQKYSKSSYAILLRGTQFASFAGVLGLRVPQPECPPTSKLPMTCMQGDIEWLATKFRRYRYKCMVNFWKRIMKMDNSKLEKYICKYDYGICKK